MVKLKSLVLENDVKRLASMLGFKEFAVKKFIDKYKDLDADDLIDVIEASKDRRRSSLMVMAAMNHNRRALKQLDNLLGFLPEQKFNERTTGFTDSGRGYQNKETQIQSVNAVKDASKKVGKLQQNVVGQFIKDIKQGKYDAMDLVRSIKTTSLGDASFSKKEFFLSLFDLIKKRTR